MKRTVVVLVALAGCERADHPRATPPPITPVAKLAPAPATDLAPVAQPAVLAVVAPREPERAMVRPERTRRSRARRLRDDELPVPPSDDPAVYQAWHDALAPDVRAQVDAFCRREGGDYQTVCGGIGPYHIPVPPSRLPMGEGDPEARHAAWLASLTVQQRRYYEEWCSSGGEERAFTELCGATPLVVQLDLATPIEFVANGVNAAQTPWLVLDRDGDGAITNDELFGDATPLPDGSRAGNGFEALAQYDANRDGVIDADDPVFDRLALWTGRTLEPLASRVATLALANHREPRCTRFGCEGERSTLVTTTGTRGAVVDVYLRR